MKEEPKRYTEEELFKCMKGLESVSIHLNNPAFKPSDIIRNNHGLYCILTEELIEKYNKNNK